MKIRRSEPAGTDAVFPVEERVEFRRGEFPFLAGEEAIDEPLEVRFRPTR